ncbi:MAG: putative bifunctional diguanylate cyclase/phosphodiesterase [Phycisphaerales bacterium]
MDRDPLHRRVLIVGGDDDFRRELCEALAPRAGEFCELVYCDGRTPVNPGNFAPLSCVVAHPSCVRCCRFIAEQDSCLPIMIVASGGATITDADGFMVIRSFADVRVFIYSRAQTNLRTMFGKLRDEAAQLRRELALRTNDAECLRHQATHDSLTALPNRTLLLERLRHCVERMRRGTETTGALLFLDLDNFKLINDGFGHEIGDRVLREVGSRLVTAVRTCDTICRGMNATAGRLGGDEFVLLLEDLDDAAVAMKVAKRLREVVRAPIIIDDRRIEVGMSVGVSNWEPGKTAEDLLREADTAMYQAKFAGKDRVALFDRRMHDNVLNRLSLEADLRVAVEKQQLFLEYQPVVCLESGRISGFEALVRWRHPSRGVITPDVFVPIAEESGQIERIGLWVIAQAARDLTSWRESTNEASEIFVSLNLSRLQMLDRAFAENVVDMLASFGLDGSSFRVEVTETAIMDHDEEIATTLGKLRDAGCRIVIDDFGTGHSSLSCLHRFPIDELKIDRGFADTLNGSRDYAAVVQAIVTLAHNLGVKVVAEGVENARHMVQLQALDCDYAQGYHFSRPIPSCDVLALMLSAPRWMKRAA